MSAAERAALRHHLARQGLSPKDIADSQKPVLFIDFIHSGRGLLTLLQEIHLWAEELGLSERVKGKMSIFGLYSPAFIARNHLKKIAFDSAKELGTPVRNPSELEIRASGKSISLPQKSEFAKLVNEIHEADISEDLYHYAGFGAHQIQQSFTPSEWVSHKDGIERATFRVDPLDDSHLEFFTLMKWGESSFTPPRCEKRLKFQASPSSNHSRANSQSPDLSPQGWDVR